MYYTRRMSMGKRKRDRQPAMWVSTTDSPTAASHPFYRRLNQLLREHRFDDFVEAQCADFYAETMGRPGVPPGIYFRLLLIGSRQAGCLQVSISHSTFLPRCCTTECSSAFSRRFVDHETFGEHPSSASVGKPFLEKMASA
jgi:hypothetical protein